MKSHVICAIKDTKAGIIFAPSVLRNSADFVRSVQVEAKNPQSMLHKFPADYDLMILGDWSETEGLLSAETQRLGSVLDLCPLS